MPDDLVADIIAFLLKRKLIVRKDDVICIGPAKVHVPAQSEYVNYHHRNWRMQALSRIGLQTSTDLLFTSPMTISHRDFTEIRRLILDVIGEVSGKVAKSDAECFALFNVDFIKVWQKNSD
jgi:hypothetical protein